jgi:hypothetical protein
MRHTPGYPRRPWPLKAAPTREGSGLVPMLAATKPAAPKLEIMDTSKQ